MRTEQLLAQMTLREKVAQMTQVEKNSISAEQVTALGIGSILSGGGGSPDENSAENWHKMVHEFIEASQKSRLGIPLIYGVDAVHGHNNLWGATIFPHNIGLGASRDPELVRRVAQATAREMKATDARWNFAPAVSHPRDIRWGRSYEGFGQDVALISPMGAAYVQGLQDEGVLPSVKHFVADGATTWGTSARVIDRDALADDQTLANANVGEGMIELLHRGAWKLDQGVSDIDEETLRRDHLPPYAAAIAAGAMNMMVSYSSWDGLKMHAQSYLLNDVLKGELGFEGFLVTDWEAIDQIEADFYACVVQSINAGIDMVMVPFKYVRFIDTLVQAVENGDVPLERIDDAVRRILNAKEKMGLFEDPFGDQPLSAVGCAEHRELAREAAQKSAVLLKNDGALPLPTDGTVLVAGVAADDIGYQCGGWTIEWMGRPGALTPGTTILEGIRDADDDVQFSATGDFDSDAAVGLVVLAEEPYAEGMGDRSDLTLSAEQIALLEKMRPQVDKLVVVLLSGRPLILTDQLPLIDALVAAWLPGTEGNGVSDLLLGDVPFTGKLGFVWPASMAQIPLQESAEHTPIWPIGHGLTLA